MKRYSINMVWMRLLCAVLLAGLCLNTISAGQPASGAPAGAPPADYQAFFDAFLAEQIAGEHIAGAAVAVVQNGELAFAKGYGYADAAAEVPVLADETLFFIGSVGKLFTWTAVMQLVEQGKLDLHVDVNAYLDFAVPATFTEPVTLHHLMTHTAGFEEDFNTLLEDDPRKILPLREQVLRYMPARVYAPGVVSAYSNYGTALAGYIVERVSGMSFDTYLAKHLLQPLGMEHSFAGNSPPPALGAALSKGYTFQDGSYLGLDFEWMSAAPCAPVRSTITDLSRFMLAHLNDGCLDGTCILGTSTVERMHSQHFSHHPQMTGMAYGFLEMEINGQRILWHQGESARFITLLALIPEQNLGLAVSYNTSPVKWREPLFRFMDAFFPANRPQIDPQPLPAWVERAAQFNGTYVSARSAHSTPQILARYITAVPVAVDQGRLTFNGWNFVETEPGLFQQIEGDRMLAFEQDENGQQWLFVGPLAYFKLPWYNTPAFLLLLLGGSLLVFLSAWVAWPVIAFRRRKRQPAEGRAAFWLAAGLGLYNFGLLAWIATALLGLAGKFVYHPEPEQIIRVLFWLSVPWTLAVLCFAARAWLRGEWGLGRRVHYSLVAAAAAAVLWLAWSHNLLGSLL